MINPISGGVPSPIQNPQGNDPKQTAIDLINKIRDEINNPGGYPARIIEDVNQLKKLESNFPKLKDQFDETCGPVEHYAQTPYPARDPGLKPLCLERLENLSNAISNS